jgi:hypothetical protein
MGNTISVRAATSGRLYEICREIPFETAKEGILSSLQAYKLVMHPRVFEASPSCEYLTLNISPSERQQTSAGETWQSPPPLEEDSTDDQRWHTIDAKAGETISLGGLLMPSSG